MSAVQPLSVSEPKATVRRRSLAPLEPVSSRSRWMLGLAFFALFVAVWAFFTLGGFVSPTFLASPVTMVKEGWLLFTEYGFIKDIGMTIWRVVGGFILAAVIAVPLGIAMGLLLILMVFISLSMPEATLKRLVSQAALAKASLLIRGLLNGSLRDTVARTQALLAGQSVAFQIDPQAFERYAITQVPSFVLVREGADGTPCGDGGRGSCAPPNDYVRLAGDVSLDYALGHIQHRTPRFSKDVGAFIQRLKG